MAVSFAFDSDQIPLAQPNGVGSLLVVEGTLTVATATEGGTAGDIPASLFRLNRIVGVLTLVNSDDDEVIPASVASDGSLLTGGGASNAAADLAIGTYKVKLLGTY